jgi:hypothetical protein
MPTAPFDAALPYTAAAALSLAIAGLAAALPTSFRLGMPAVGPRNLGLGGTVSNRAGGKVVQ